MAYFDKDAQRWVYPGGLTNPAPGGAVSPFAKPATGAAGSTLPGSATGFTPAYGGKPAVPSPEAMAKEAAEANLANMGLYSDMARRINELNYQQWLSQGGKPEVPDAAAISRAIAEGNLANMGLYSDLAGQINALNYAELIKQIEASYPGYRQGAEQASANVGNWQAGRVAPDVRYLLGQQAAERGVARGGVLTDADYLRALGLTSQELQERGLQGHTALLAAAPRTDLYDITKNFISPEAAFNAKLQANIAGAPPHPGFYDPTKMFIDPNDMYNAQLYANLIAAAPDPAAAALANLGAVRGGAGAGMANTVPGGGGASLAGIADILRRYAGAGLGNTGAGANTGTGTSGYFEPNPYAPPMTVGAPAPATNVFTGGATPDLGGIPEGWRWDWGGIMDNPAVNLDVFDEAMYNQPGDLFQYWPEGL